MALQQLLDICQNPKKTNDSCFFIPDSSAIWQLKVYSPTRKVTLLDIEKNDNGLLSFVNKNKYYVYHLPIINF